MHKAHISRMIPRHTTNAVQPLSSAFCPASGSGPLPDQPIRSQQPLDPRSPLWPLRVRVYP